jgi:hypothetical protein
MVSTSGAVTLGDTLPASAQPARLASVNPGKAREETSMRAADDFAVIRARMEELQRERREPERWAARDSKDDPLGPTDAGLVEEVKRIALGNASSSLALVDNLERRIVSARCTQAPKSYETNRTSPSIIRAKRSLPNGSTVTACSAFITIPVCPQTTAWKKLARRMNM